MNWLDEIAHSGPKDIYEKAALSLDMAQVIEFLVLECQSKDRLLKILGTILKQEAGDNWWQLYSDQIMAQTFPPAYEIKDRSRVITPTDIAI